MLKRVFKAENIKLKRSFLLYMHLIILLAFPILLGLYYDSRKLSITSTTMMIIFYEILAIASPIIISIVICLVFDREEKAGNFKNWLNQPYSKAKAIHSQLSYYWLWYLFEIIATTLIYYLILVSLYHITGISFLKVIVTSIVFSLCGLVQYELTQTIALKWNIGGSLIMGFFGTIISLLSITSLFDLIWPVIPWAWQIRLITFWRSDISLSLTQLTALEYICPFIMTILIIILCRNYFNKWQGRK